MAIRYTGAYTYSRLNDADQCLSLFKFRHIDKRPEPSSPHFVKGNRIHNGLESFLKGHVPKIPAEAESLAVEIKGLKKFKGLRSEEAWGFDEQWKPLPHESGYFSPLDKVRAKIDVLKISGVQATVIDFKSGQVRDAGEDQVRFYGLLALLKEPKVKVAALELWFVEHGEIRTYDPVKRVDADRLKASYNKRFIAISSETKFPPKVSMKCKWCAFSKYKGGPCKAG